MFVNLFSDQTDVLLVSEMHQLAQESLQTLSSQVVEATLKRLVLREEVERLEAQRLQLTQRNCTSDSYEEENVNEPITTANVRLQWSFNFYFLLTLGSYCYSSHFLIIF